MQRFREWRENLKKEQDAKAAAKLQAEAAARARPQGGGGGQRRGSASVSVGVSASASAINSSAHSDSPPFQSRTRGASAVVGSGSADRHAYGDGGSADAEPRSRSRAGSQYAKRDSLAAPSPSSSSSSSSSSPSSLLSFAELDRLRRDRHSIFVSILRDADSFAAFLRFLPAAQQQELLFVCEVNQLLERQQLPQPMDEADVCMQAIKIANIFLRNADDQADGGGGGGGGRAQTDPSASLLQVPSIQPATRRHLQLCIPRSVPAYLQPATVAAASGEGDGGGGGGSAFESAGSGGGSSASQSAGDSVPASRYDSKMVLTLLEVARDQVEESISKKSLQRFLDLTAHGGAADSHSGTVRAHDDELSALHSDYTFDDCVPHAPNIYEQQQRQEQQSAGAADCEEESGGLGYVFRSFLLYLMEDHRHRILVSWAQVHRALALLKGTELDREADTAAAAAAAGQEAAAPDASPPPLQLSQLHAIYTSLEDAYRAFYPDYHLRPPTDLMLSLADPSDLPSPPPPAASSDADAAAAAAASHLLSPTSPFVPADPRESARQSLDADLAAALDAAASESEVAQLRAAAADLALKLRPMCVKMDKILRYTFWPQFCKSEQFHRLSSIKRPVKIAPLPALAVRAPPTKGERQSSSQQSAGQQQQPPAAPKSVGRVKHALVSSLKQQKVTREMLVLECASWEQVAARRQGQMRDGMHMGASGATAAAAGALPQQSEERQRLFEYVCVMKSSPVLPARPSVVQQRLAREAAVTTSSAAGQSARASSSLAHPRANANLSSPPLPPRPHASKLQSPSPSAPLVPAPGTVLRGNQSLSLFYRYPSADHSSSSLPAHLVDLAFPLLPDAGNQENVCLCTKAASSVQQLHHSTRTRDEPDAVFTPPPTTSTTTAGDSARSHAAHDDLSSDGGPISNRLYNLICTQQDGTLLYGCVLQVTQSELVEERWEEVEPPDSDTDSGAARALAADSKRASSQAREGASGPLRPSASAEDIAKATPSAAASAVGSNLLAAHTAAGMAGSLTAPSVPAPAPTSASDSADSATARGPASKLSQMLDGFAKDIAMLVDKVQNSGNSNNSNSNSSGSSDTTAADSAPADQSTDSSAEAGASTSVGVDSPATAASVVHSAVALSSSPPIQPPSLSPVPVPSPNPPTNAALVSGGSPALSSVTAAAQLGAGVQRSSTLAAFYAVASPPAISLSPAAASPVDGGVAGGADGGGVAGQARSVGGGLSLLSSAPLGGRRKEVLIHRHHRVLRVHNQYAVVLLTRHPLFNLLRAALAHFFKQQGTRATSKHDDGVEPVDEQTRRALRASFPAGLQGDLLSLFDSASFYRLLCYTHPPRHSLDLFGLSAHLYAPSYLLTPCIDFRFDLLFRCLHPRRLLLVLECLITERKVVLLSNQNSMLTLACECLLALLYPFSWKYLYIPLLPYSLFKYLQCPTPFLMGVHACYRRKARDLTDRDVVFVDLDHDEVTMPPMSGPRERAAAGGTAAAAAATANAATVAPVSIDTPYGAASAASVSDPQSAFHLPFQVREQLLSVCHRLFAPEIEQLETGGGILTEREALLDEHLRATAEEQGGEAAPPSPPVPIGIDSLVTPPKPSIDEESGRLIDPYGSAESPVDSRPMGRMSRAGSMAAARPDAPALSSSVSSASSLRSLLLQLELVKVWSHLLKNYRSFVIHLSPSSSADLPILLFDTPAFLATKPAHYVPFLTTLTNSSYFPLFIDERSCPLGLLPVQRDAFDRYEAALSGTRIHVWKDAYAFKRKAQRRWDTGSEPYQWNNSGGNDSSHSGESSRLAAAPPSPCSPTSSREPFESSRRLSLGAWLGAYQSSGVDPSLHHAKYLAGWNPDSNLQWRDIERLPRRWFQGEQQEKMQEQAQVQEQGQAPPPAPVSGIHVQSHSSATPSLIDCAAGDSLADSSTPTAAPLAPPSAHGHPSTPGKKSRLYRTGRRPSRSSASSASASANSSRAGSLSRAGSESQPSSRPSSRPHSPINNA